MRASVDYVCVSIVCYRGRRRRISFKTLTRSETTRTHTVLSSVHSGGVCASELRHSTICGALSLAGIRRRRVT